MLRTARKGPSSAAGFSSAAGPAPARVIQQRLDLIEDLHRRYGGAAASGIRMQWKYTRKKYLWRIIVGGSNCLKRGLDIGVSLAALIALSPLFAVVALIVRMDGGPALFWQTRVGQWGREFPFPKFRSMVPDAERLKDKLLALNDHQNGITFKMKNDPRITRAGRFIRKASIDELPQLWCVLKGDMSLVGPRPPLPREVRNYTLKDRRRLDLKPGLTCIWQVSGRGDIPFDRQVELDVRYVESQSLWLDIGLLLKTIPAILIGKGAY
jgi:lipopolysaccharide/colanic/teichoic acid biosynthesis glycosyltransferase